MPTRKTAARKASKASKGAQGPHQRRRPTQARSQRRLESIVNAAAECFAQFGFAESTMEGIAARAGTSIGSVYQFFPNKKAVFREVALRCVEESRRAYGELLGENPLGQPWHVLLERIIDGFRRMHERSVLMQAIWRNLELYGEYAEEDQALVRELVEATAMLFAGWAPTIDADRRRMVALTVVNTVVTLMMVLAREEDEAQQEALTRESKLMLVRYLSGYLGEPDEWAEPSP